MITKKDTPYKRRKSTDILYPTPEDIDNPENCDVPETTLKTLASWTSELTKSKQKIPPPGTNSTNVDKNAYKINIDNDIKKIGLNQFSLGDESEYSSEYNSTFGADTVPGLSKGSRQIGKDETGRVSGHEFLKNIQEGQPVDVEVHGETKNIKEATVNQTYDEYLTNTVLRVNRFSKSNLLTNSSAFKIKGTEYSHKQLANVGIALTARASTEMNSSNKDYDGGSDGAAVKAILPGWNQLGPGVTYLGTDSFDAISALNKINSGPEDMSISPYGSNGQMNNPLDQYSGISAFGATALSVSLFVAVSTVILGLNTLLGLLVRSNNKNDPSTHYDGVQKRYYLGQYGQKRSSGKTSGFPPIPMDQGYIKNLLGIKCVSVSDFQKNVEAGLLRYYGSDKTNLKDLFGIGVGSNIGSMLARVVDSAGYYSVIARGIVRSGVELITHIKSFSKGNIISIISKILDFFEVLRSSKLMQSLNVFASIGESALNMKSALAGSEEEDSDNNRTSFIDAKPNEFNSITKSRLRLSSGKGSQNQSLKLAWSCNRAVSLLSTPKVLQYSVLQGLSQTGPGALIKGPSELSRNIFARSDNRLPSEAVEYLEGILESEYVPFYFHDLRTNELISFHAFIASIQDDYSPSWETIEAPGRIDPVKIYKNTTRKIGLSFYVVSTSDNDFQEMWIKINKLITLVYPQYTAGRVVQDSYDNPKNRFIVPFTQLPSASPLIRIRLGDLFKSNYSKFALARLFGLGNQYTVNAGSNKLMIDNESFLTEVAGNTYDKKLGQLQNIEDNIENLKDLVFMLKTDRIKSNDIISDLKEPDKIKIASDLNNVQLIPVKLNSKKDKTIYVKIKLEEIKDTEKKTKVQNITNEIAVSSDMLSVTPESLKKFLSTGRTDTAISKFTDFMSDKNNAIAYSFKQTGGKGLAGVIESMNFDWYDRVTWETETIGSKAPKVCKISISFAPIHDISPGIDVNGYNRAPIYQVGDSSDQSINMTEKNKSSELTTEKLSEKLLGTISVSNGIKTIK